MKLFEIGDEFANVEERDSLHRLDMTQRARSHEVGVALVKMDPELARTYGWQSWGDMPGPVVLFNLLAKYPAFKTKIERMNGAKRAFEAAGGTYASKIK